MSFGGVDEKKLAAEIIDNAKAKLVPELKPLLDVLIVELMDQLKARKVKISVEFE